MVKAHRALQFGGSAGAEFAALESSITYVFEKINTNVIDRVKFFPSTEVRSTAGLEQGGETADDQV
jgi:hypothetical protein